MIPCDPYGPHDARALIESALDEAGWPWCCRVSLLLDAALICEELSGGEL